MSEVFYRKWRPRRLDQVVGQETVTQTLRNAVALGRVAHAYLFCGPRGTGKTSTARILAKAVNCLSPQDGEPDDVCEVCVSINEGRALDLIEIDAASNRGIDDIRDLRDKVNFAPNVARYKVYIIDEVHMLTPAAFNALLKTLEEPPGHVIFVLATTEVHEVPLTIISRCQRFDFRRIPLEITEARLAKLCADEGMEAATEALALLARASAGSLRDAENLLEQALVSYGSPLSEEQVRDLLELGSDERALELVAHIVDRSVQQGLTVINEVAEEGNDLRQFHRSVMQYLRCVLLLKSGVDSSLGYPEETKAELRPLAERTSLHHLVHTMKTFSKVDARRDTGASLPLELALVESSLEAEADVSKVAASASTAVAPDSVAAPVVARPQPPARSPAVSRPDDGESRASPPSRARGYNPRPAAGPARPEVRESAPEEMPSEPAARLERQWNAIMRTLRTEKGKRFNLGALLRSTSGREVADGTITLKFSHASHQERMQEELDDPQASSVLRDAFAQAMGEPYEIRAAGVGGTENGVRQSAAQRSHLVRAAQAMGAQVVGEKEEGQHE